MIQVTQLNGKKYWINPHMIESMEKTPDLTMESLPDLTLTLLSGRKLIIKDSPEEVIQKIIEYRNKIAFQAQEVL